jgi:hypothetical protein
VIVHPEFAIALICNADLAVAVSAVLNARCLTVVAVAMLFDLCDALSVAVASTLRLEIGETQATAAVLDAMGVAMVALALNAGHPLLTATAFDMLAAALTLAATATLRLGLPATAATLNLGLATTVTATTTLVGFRCRRGGDCQCRYAC